MQPLTETSRLGKDIVHTVHMTRKCPEFVHAAGCLFVCCVVQSLERMMMETREPLEWHFKQLDHSMGLSFKTNFNFAIVGHLLKGSLYSLIVS